MVLWRWWKDDPGGLVKRMALRESGLMERATGHGCQQDGSMKTRSSVPLRVGVVMRMSPTTHRYCLILQEEDRLLERFPTTVSRDVRETPAFQHSPTNQIPHIENQIPSFIFLY